MNNSDIDGQPIAVQPIDARIVVVGASHSAVALSDRLRSAGHRGALTLIGSEPRLPYHRPPLSKAFLKGDVDVAALALRDDTFYRDSEITLRTGERVVEIRRGDWGTGVVITQPQEVLDDTRSGDRPSAAMYEFDRLVLATGARPRSLPIPGAHHRDVLTLRDVSDSSRLRDRAHRGPIVVIGGGFIGLEAAATITALGGEVTVVEVGQNLMGRAVGPETANWCAAAHSAMGVRIELGSSPTRIETDGDRILGVRLKDGRMIAAATVLVGIGVTPRDELARQVGLDCVDGGGVIVDANCLASDGVTVAIGDCTVQPHPVAAPGNMIRLESVDNADEQAARASSTLLGTDPTDRGVPWFWSDQGSCKLQMAGLVGNHDDMAVRIDPKRADRRVVIYTRAGVMTAVECFNAPGDFLLLRKALARKTSVSKNALVNSAIPLRELLNATPTVSVGGSTDHGRDSR